METLHIKVYSDFICPWCYIGKMRLDRIKRELAGEIHLKIETQAYQLYPHIPKGGSPKASFAKNTKPGMGRSLRAEAESENISINYKLIDTIPNSLEAHRLMALIHDLDLRFDLSKDIFCAYFENGRNIEDHDVLSELAKKNKIEQSVIDRFLNSNQGAETVKSHLDEAAIQFISLVPTIELTPDLKILGLQSAEVWKNYFRRAVRMNRN